MTREEFIKQRCEIDKITEEEFEEKYRVVKCNCGNPFCNGYRCLDSDDLLKENQELEKQLEEYKEQVNKGLYSTCLPYTTGYNKAIKDKEIQQKEFIKYLENMLDDENDIFSVVRVKDVLHKCKQIIGDDK